MRELLEVDATGLIGESRKGYGGRVGRPSRMHQGHNPGGGLFGPDILDPTDSLTLRGFIGRLGTIHSIYNSFFELLAENMPMRQG